MKHEKQKYYDSLIESKTITENLLLAVVGTINPKISKYAYLKKKYANSYTEEMYRMNESKFYEYIGIRNTIVKALRERYTQSQIIEKAKSISQDDFVARRIIDDVVSILENGDYQLMSADS